VTSILNTNNQEIVIPEPRLKLAKIKSMPFDTEGVNQGKRYRGKEVLEKLRPEHLNSEEKNIRKHLSRLLRHFLSAGR
jgi:hypothetical protein